MMEIETEGNFAPAGVERRRCTFDSLVGLSAALSRFLWRKEEMYCGASA